MTQDEIEQLAAKAFHEIEGKSVGDGLHGFAKVIIEGILAGLDRSGDE